MVPNKLRHISFCLHYVEPGNEVAFYLHTRKAWERGYSMVVSWVTTVFFNRLAMLESGMSTLETQRLGRRIRCVLMVTSLALKELGPD